MVVPPVQRRPFAPPATDQMERILSMEFMPAKTIISGYDDGSSWFGDNYSVNIYKACCHGRDP